MRANTGPRIWLTDANEVKAASGSFGRFIR